MEEVVGVESYYPIIGYGWKCKESIMPPAGVIYVEVEEKSDFSGLSILGRVTNPDILYGNRYVILVQRTKTDRGRYFDLFANTEPCKLSEFDLSKQFPPSQLTGFVADHWVRNNAPK